MKRYKYELRSPLPDDEWEGEGWTPGLPGEVVFVDDGAPSIVYRLVAYQPKRRTATYRRSAA